MQVCGRPFLPQMLGDLDGLMTIQGELPANYLHGRKMKNAYYLRPQEKWVAGRPRPVSVKKEWEMDGGLIQGLLTFEVAYLGVTTGKTAQSPRERKRRGKELLEYSVHGEHPPGLLSFPLMKDQATDQDRGDVRYLIHLGLTGHPSPTEH